MPTGESSLVHELFEELGVIQGGTRAGLPVYKERFLSATRRNASSLPAIGRKA